MQKWERHLIILLFILAVLGGILGFVMSNWRIGDINILAGIDLFGLIELILLAIAIACAVFDIYETYESKELLGTVKFKVFINTRKRLRNIAIFLALGIFFEFGIFLGIKDAHIIPLCFITLILTIMLMLHNKIEDGISESGILYCGIYHSWEDIKSHNFINNTLVELAVMNNFFGFEYTNIIKFIFDEKDKEDIERFLSEKPYIIDESSAI